MRPDESSVSEHMSLFEEAAARAAVVLELGVGHGNGSTRAFNRGLCRSPEPDKLHIGVDFDPDKPDEPPDSPWWTIVYGKTEDPATAAAVKLVLGNRVPDLLYIDTHHTKEQMASELEVWSPLAAERTVWLFHDTWMFDQYNPMVEAIEEFVKQYPCWKYTEVTKKCHGVGRMEWQQVIL